MLCQISDVVSWFQLEIALAHPIPSVVSDKHVQSSSMTLYRTEFMTVVSPHICCNEVLSSLDEN